MLLCGQNVGFIGLGLMGSSMVQNLLDANLNLSVYNRTLAKCASAIAQGAKPATSPRDIGNMVGPGIIILCVSDTPSLTSAITGSEGLLSGLAPDALVIDMGTSEVRETKRLAELVEQAQARYIDAPVSGGEVGAQNGTLSIMAGGEIQDIERAKPLFEVLGNSLTHIGSIGTGQATKAANQAIVATTVSIIAESFLLAQAAGADLTKVRKALLAGFAGSRILELHGQRMIDETFEPGGRANTQSKDIRQAVDLAQELELNLPLLHKCRDLWGRMVESGYGDLDQSGYFEYARAEQSLSSKKDKNTSS